MEKPGKTEAYSVGAVATMHLGNYKNYLLAYAEMGPANKARSTIDGVWASLGSLWKEVSQPANGGTVCVACLGAPLRGFDMYCRRKILSD